MESDILYRVQKEELPKLEGLLTECFAADPLYCELIPDEDVRRRLMPELFACDMTEFYETCEIFADSEKLQGILVVSDESEPFYSLLCIGGAGAASDGWVSDQGGPLLKDLF